MSTRLEDRVRRGEAVREILTADDSIVRGVLSSMKELYKADIVNTGLVDQDKREKLYMRYIALVDFENALAAIIQDGQIAKQELQRQKR